jgi:predicted transcriptional regulator of viral defense system
MDVVNNTLEKYMNYIEFQKSFRPFTVFSLSDIRQIDPVFCRRRLNEWQEKGYIRKVVKGYYIFSDNILNENALFEIANYIYAPSYISFEMALSYYGLIPESIYGITSASTRKTNHFITQVGSFFYRTIQPRFYFGFDLVRNNNKFFKMAYPEKAFLDLLYIKTELQDTEDFESLRVDKEEFIRVMDYDKMTGFLDIYKKVSLKRRMNNFWRFIRHA